MPDRATIIQQGGVHLYRSLVAGDIDGEQLLHEVEGSGLNPTLIRGSDNNWRCSDGTGALLVRRVVRGDGVNTLLADAGTLATTQNIFGMTTATDGTDARIATPGSIIDGFVGLTKHAVYYLGTSGQISLTPGTVPVIVGVAVSTTEFLFWPCCCACIGHLELQYCFSSNMFLCDPLGAKYLLLDGGAGECLPALEFANGVDNYWYCGFETPPTMDTTQAASLDLRFVGSGAPAVPIQWVGHYRSVLAAANVFSAGVATLITPAPIAPAGANILVKQSLTIPPNSLVLSAQNRQRLMRQGSVDTYTGKIYLIGATLSFVCN